MSSEPTKVTLSFPDVIFIALVSFGMQLTIALAFFGTDNHLHSIDSHLSAIEERLATPDMLTTHGVHVEPMQIHVGGDE